jgi:cytidylate kinase
MAILTISREYGSGGLAIGRRVAARLGYQLVDKERLLQDLERAGPRWVRVAKEADEVCPTLWERHDWQYRGYVSQLENLILAYAVGDNVVIIGRGGSFLLQGVTFCLRARLVAPLEARLEEIMTRESLPRKAAARLIARVDAERACYIKANYGADWNADNIYDLTLNTDSLTHARVVDILAENLAAKDRLATPDAKARLALSALGYRLKAHIAADPQVLAPTLKVFPEEDTLVVSGIMHTPKELHRLQEIAREVCGDRPVRFDLRRRV